MDACHFLPTNFLPMVDANFMQKKEVSKSMPFTSSETRRPFKTNKLVFQTASRNAHANRAHYRNVLCVKEGSALTIQLLYFFAF